MDAQKSHLEARHEELFAVLAALNSGLKHGTITSLDQVRATISPIFPEPTRGTAPTNPATHAVVGKGGAYELLRRQS